MIDGMFVFDNAIHVYDMSDENLREERADSAFSRDHLATMGAAGGWPGVPKTTAELSRRWSIEEVHDLVFTDAPTDMAMAQVVPIFDWYKDVFAPVHAQHAMAERYPERVMFCGGVDPLYPDCTARSSNSTTRSHELGAKSIKFYNGHVDGRGAATTRSSPTRSTSAAASSAVNVLQFHKGFPFGLMNVEQLRPTDLQAPARDFPDMTFIIHHLSLPYFDECVWVANRFPNVYLSLAEQHRRVLRAAAPAAGAARPPADGGRADKLLWASDAALLGSPRPYIEGFLEIQIPEDLRVGYGYPQITRSDKEKFLGLNFARIMGVDVEAKVRELAEVAV